MSALAATVERPAAPVRVYASRICVECRETWVPIGPRGDRCFTCRTRPRVLSTMSPDAVAHRTTARRTMSADRARASADLERGRIARVAEKQKAQRRRAGAIVREAARLVLIGAWPKTSEALYMIAERLDPQLPTAEAGD